MHATERFAKKDIEKYTGEKRLQQLHSVMNNVFKLPPDIIQSKDPIENLNELIFNHSIFSFSFVRHPYTRYDISISIKK